MGGRGSNGIRIKQGEGIALTLQGKRQIYWLDVGDKLRNLVSTQTLQGNGKDVARKLIENGNATKLTKTEVETLREKRREERTNRPDYELGNAFHEPGWGAKRRKSTYRYKRSR